jgi:hypothetical protein
MAPTMPAGNENASFAMPFDTKTDNFIYQDRLWTNTGKGEKREMRFSLQRSVQDAWREGLSCRGLL